MARAADGDSAPAATEALVAALRAAAGALPDAFASAGIDGAAGASPPVVIRVSTALAYHCRPARIIVATLQAHAALSPDLAERMETALHEAVANAAVHGNLGLSRPEHRDLDGYAEQESLIGHLLERPDLRQRVITISLRIAADEIEVAVQDQGHGYIDRPALQTRRGRGLFIIRAFCDRMAVSDGGRRLTMAFSR